MSLRSLNQRVLVLSEADLVLRMSMNPLVSNEGFLSAGGIEFGKGSFTKQQVEQSAQLAGAQAKDLDRIFFTGGNPLNLSAYLSRLTSSSRGRTADVSRFVEEFKKDELFGFKPGRRHQGFNKFSYQQRVRTPKRMGRSLRALSEELDRRRDQIL